LSGDSGGFAPSVSNQGLVASMTIAPANADRSSSVSREYGMANSTMSDEASISSLLTR